MNYQHRFTGQVDCELTPGKVVCVGRNYADHARELNNPIPASPLLFIKPATSLVSMSPSFSIPTGRGSVHHELELALLIGRDLPANRDADYLAAIAGVGLAIDLTLRDVQSQLKEKGKPWEIAKAFDGSCPCSVFVDTGSIPDLQALDLVLERNGKVQQSGNTSDMLFPVATLLSEINRHFTLQAGDLVLTGTPAGVGPLEPGDTLVARLVGHLEIHASVISSQAEWAAGDS